MLHGLTTFPRFVFTDTLLFRDLLFLFGRYASTISVIASNAVMLFKQSVPYSDSQYKNMVLNNNEKLVCEKYKEFRKPCK